MKEYNRYVLWLDYFNSENTRKKGRKVPLSISTRNPSIDELYEACKKLNLEPVRSNARYPRSFWKDSGYVTVVKKGRKQEVMLEVAKELTKIRGQKKINM